MEGSTSFAVASKTGQLSSHLGFFLVRDMLVCLHDRLLRCFFFYEGRRAHHPRTYSLHHGLQAQELHQGTVSAEMKLRFEAYFYNYLNGDLNL